MDKKKIGTFVLIIIGIAIVIGIIFVAYQAGRAGQPQEKAVTVVDIFVDIDGDGDLDYLPEAKVIFNTGEIVQENPSLP